MPQLIQKIEGEILTNVIGDVSYVSTIIGEIQQEDYIKLSGLVALLQNLTQTEETFSFEEPLYYGLPNKDNIKIITLEIEY